MAERLGELESIPGAYSTLITGMAGTQHKRFRGFYQIYNRIERPVWLPRNEAGTLGPACETLPDRSSPMSAYGGPAPLLVPSAAFTHVRLLSARRACLCRIPLHCEP